MKKIKLFTHTDLDGIGCAILAKKCFINCDIEFCDYENINEKIERFIKSDAYENYTRIYITDISVNESIAQLLDCIQYEHYIKLIDHHSTALWLNKYEWASVSILNSFKKLTSGTELFYNYLLKDNETLKNNFNLVNDITIYDSWRWMNEYNPPYVNSKNLNRLFQLLGRERFISEILFGKYIEDFALLLEIEDNKIKNLLEKKQLKLIKNQIFDTNGILRTFGYVFSETNVSELGNYILKNNNDIDFVAIVNISNKSASLRGLPENNIHLGEDIAKMFNGGGHKDSAGCSLIGEFFRIILDDLKKVN